MFIILPVTAVPCPYCKRNYNEWCKDWKGKALDGKSHRSRVHLATKTRELLKWTLVQSKVDTNFHLLKHNNSFIEDLI